LSLQLERIKRELKNVTEKEEADKESLDKMTDSQQQMS